MRMTTSFEAGRISGGCDPAALGIYWGEMPDPPGDEEAPQAEHEFAPGAGLSAAPESRSEKIERLRRAVENGTYQIDPDSVADSMLRHLRPPPE